MISEETYQKALHIVELYKAEQTIKQYNLEKLDTREICTYSKDCVCRLINEKGF